MHRIATGSRRQALAPEVVPPNWDAMLKAEPRLRTLAKATAAAGRLSSDRTKSWLAVRDVLDTLVGWFCDNPALDSSAHWSTARGRLRHLFDVGGRK